TPERPALVYGFVVLAGEIALRLHLELPHGVAHVRQARPTLRGVVGGVREIAGEDDEDGLVGKRVDVGDRLVERPRGIWVHRRARKAPVQIGHLEEHEVLPAALLPGGEAHAPQPRAEDDARDSCRGQACGLDEFGPVTGFRHVLCTSDTPYTARYASDSLP